ncbi:hypothetical protein I547_0432 [Mycobacterium kansasii 824]|nr:hypothetical protein I547_0432 [Mycobacterium kansasii 824]
MVDCGLGTAVFVSKEAIAISADIPDFVNETSGSGPVQDAYARCAAALCPSTKPTNR